MQGADVGGMRQSAVEERQRLVQLVQLQAQEIDSLKDEVLTLSRKGVHVQPPSQPPPIARLGSRGSSASLPQLHNSNF